MLEPVATAQIDSHGENQRKTSHTEAVIISARQSVNVVVGKASQVIDITTLLYGQSLESRKCLGRDGAIKVLMRQRRNLRHIAEASLAEEQIRDLGCRDGREHGADVDGHVEQAEAIVTESTVFGLIVKVTHHHLQVTLEQTRADGDKS